MAEHELVRIPAFHRLKVAAQGSIGYVAGNVEYICYSEGVDDLILNLGQVLPCNAQFAELWNPFSWPAEVQIIRGAPIATPVGVYDMARLRGRQMSFNIGGVTLLNVASAGDPAGRRRGIGIMSKRGIYNVDFSAQSSGTGFETIEALILPKAAWQFMGLRPVGTFSNTLTMRRTDGSINENLVSIYGSYTQAEIDAWKASVGYTSPEFKFTVGTAGYEMQVGPDVAAFLTMPETTTMRIELDAWEIGDRKSRVREV